MTWDASGETEGESEVLGEWVDSNGVLWVTETIWPFGSRGVMVRAVCRPESCADGHRCGKLDIGVTGGDS